MLSKSDTLQLKGSAILIMVLLHLFNRSDYVEKCTVVINFMGEPLVSQLAKFMEICVPLYLFLSGYGLFLLFQKTHNVFPLKRILKLYFIFWTCFMIFIPMGCFLLPEQYPENWRIFIENFTAWKTSYNWEWWFIFPYILLLLISNTLFKYILRWNFITSFFVSCVIYVVAYLVISLYKSFLVEYFALFNFFELLRMVCSFMWGALFAKYDLFARIKTYIKLNTLWINVIMAFILVLIFIIRTIIPIHAASVLFMVIFACCFHIIKKSPNVESFFMLMGKHSTNIWLVHTFFCYYYFHNFIYELKYPILIYITTLGLSFIASLLINKVYQLLFERLTSYIRNI